MLVENLHEVFAEDSSTAHTAASRTWCKLWRSRKKLLLSTFRPCRLQFGWPARLTSLGCISRTLAGNKKKYLYVLLVSYNDIAISAYGRSIEVTWYLWGQQRPQQACRSPRWLEAECAGLAIGDGEPGRFGWPLYGTSNSTNSRSCKKTLDINFLGNHKADNSVGLEENMLSNFNIIGCNMSIKVHKT